MKKLCIHNGRIITENGILENHAIVIDSGKIAAILNKESLQKYDIDDIEKIDAKNNFVSAGFIDTHIHGFGGFGVENKKPEAILEMSKSLVNFGVTGFLPTTYTAKEEAIIETVIAIKNAIGKEEGAKILGIHLEGPFISPHHVGGQDKDGVSKIDLEMLKRIIKASGETVVSMTVAPELEKIEELVKYCNEKKINLQIGHSDAKNEDMDKALELGICHITHMFNAMSPLHKRELGVVGNALVNNDFSCEIIADGVHVPFKLVKHLYNSKTDDKVVLITDALAPAGTFGNDLEILGEPVYFDKCFKRKRDDMIVGSALTINQGIKNLITAGISLEKAVISASMNPANILGLSNKGKIKTGYDADIVIFNNNIEIINTIINGKIII